MDFDPRADEKKKEPVSEDFFTGNPQTSSSLNSQLSSLSLGTQPQTNNILTPTPANQNLTNTSNIVQSNTNISSSAELLQNDSIFNLIDNSNNSHFDSHNDMDFFFSTSSNNTASISNYSQKNELKLDDFSTDKFKKLLDKIYESTSEHALILQKKMSLEQESQNYHNNMWVFKMEQRNVNAQCGDGNPVNYLYSLKTAIFNDQLYSSLVAKFQQLHEFNVAPVFSTLVQQAIAEHQLSHYIYSFDSSFKEDITYKKLKPVVDSLFDLLNRKGKPLSAHSVTAIRQLIMYSGGYIVHHQMSNRQSAVDDSLLVLDDKTPKALHSVLDTSSYFLGKLLINQSAVWGSSLFQPSIKDVIELKLLTTLLADNFSSLSKSTLTEAEVLSLLAQIPWKELSSCTVEQVANEILVPIQKTLSFLADKQQYAKIVLTLGKIVALISFVCPQMMVQCIAILTRSPWPSKMLFTPIFPLINWTNLKQEDISLVFKELYHLFNESIKSYQQSTPEKKNEHRRTFTDYLVQNLSNLLVVYQVDPSLGNLNGNFRYPIFGALGQLGIVSAIRNDHELSQVIVEELFYFGFLSPSRTNIPNAVLDPVNMLRTEAGIELGKVLKAKPSLFGHVLNMIGIHLPYLNYQQVTQFITNTLSQSSWSIDLGSLNWLSYLLSHRTLPQPDDNQSNTVSLFLNAFVAHGPHVQFSQEVNVSGIFIGTKLMELIKWETCDPTARMIALLIVLGSKSIGINGEWLWAAIISSNIGMKLSRAPFDEPFINGILNLTSNQVICPDELSLAQVVCSLSVAESRLENKATISSVTDWLQKYGTFQRLETLLQKQVFSENISLQGLLLKLINILKHDEFKSYGHVSRLINLVLGRKNGPDTIRTVMIQTLAIPGMQVKCVQLWLAVLGVYINPESPVCGHLNSLIHSIFVAQPDCSLTLSILGSQQFSKRDIQKIHSNGNEWLAYALALNFLPVLPPVNANIDERAVGETRIGLMKDLALETKNGVLALIFWEQFFILYFELMASASANAPRLISVQTKDYLGKHFTTVAQNFGETNRKLYTLYYSFSTWSEVAILPSSIFLSKDNLALESLRKELPPPFQLQLELSATQTISTDNILDLGDETPKQEVTPKQTTKTETFGDVNLEPSKLLSLMPKYVPPPKIEELKEKESFVAFSNEVNAILSKLGANLGKEQELPLVKEILDLLIAYNNMCEKLKNGDEKFLQFTKQLYVNQPAEFPMAVACNYGNACSGPARINCPSIKIEPGYPTVRQDISSNRETYNKDYVAFFNLAKLLASKMVILDSLVNQIVSNNLSQLGVTLYFGVLPIILGNVITVESTCRSFATTLSTLGSAFIKNRSEYQTTLLQHILSKSSRPKFPFQDVCNSIVYDSFNPASLLLNGGINEYLGMIEIISQTPTQLSDREYASLAARFEIHTHFGKVLANADDRIVDRLFLLLSALLPNDGLGAIASYIIQNLIMLSFPKYLDRVLDTILSTGTFTSSSWGAIFSSIRFQTLDVEAGRKLMQTLKNRLPLPDRFMGGIIQLARNVVLDIPPYVVQLRAENSADKFTPVPSEGSLWIDIDAFVGACVAPYVQDKYTKEYLSPSNFEMLLEMIRDIIKVACPDLINRVWYLIEKHINAYVKANNVDISFINKFIQTLPWNISVFHIKDSRTLRYMTRFFIQIDSAPVQYIASSLNWKNFVADINRNISQSNAHPLELEGCGISALEFLKLFMYLYLSNYDVFDEEMKSLAFGNSPDGIKWKLIDFSHLNEVFDGVSFLELLKKSGNKDPSKPLMECLLFLNDITQASKINASSAACLVREARSVMFFTIQNSVADRLYWYLSYQDHIMLLANVIIPLTRQYASEAVISQMVIAVLSCLNNLQVWPSPWQLEKQRTVNFFNTTTPPGPIKNNDIENKKFLELNSKIQGIVNQFAGTASPIMAVEILNIGPQAISFLDPLILIYEETLRSYFTTTKSSNPIGEVCACMQIPVDASYSEFISRCIANNSPLTLRVALDQRRRQLSSGSEWMHHALFCIDVCTQYSPKIEHYEFDVLALWFFVVDIVGDKRFLIEPSTEEKILSFQKLLTMLAVVPKGKLVTSKIKGTGTHLAARACLIFLDRIIIQKKNEDMEEPKKKYESARLMDQLEKLLAAKNDPSFSAFPDFFQEAETFLSPLCSLKEFKVSICKTLAPIYVYLQKL